MTREETDSELIAQAKEERATFGLLYERYVKKIYNYIYYRVGNHDDAEDLTGRTFFRALRKFDDYVDRGAPFSAWLYRIAHNLVANFHRDRSRHKQVPLEATQPTEIQTNSTEFAAVVNEEREELLKAIRRLHPDRQKLLVLKFIERLPNAEIGQIMGRSEGAIKSLYHRTLVALRRDLIPSDEDG